VEDLVEETGMTEAEAQQLHSHAWGEQNDCNAAVSEYENGNDSAGGRSTSEQQPVHAHTDSADDELDGGGEGKICWVQNSDSSDDNDDDGDDGDDGDDDLPPPRDRAESAIKKQPELARARKVSTKGGIGGLFGVSSGHIEELTLSRTGQDNAANNTKDCDSEGIGQDDGEFIFIEE
jgi:hypothetical protein